MDDGLLLVRMILAVATLIFALSVMHSANAARGARDAPYQWFNLLSSPAGGFRDHQEARGIQTSLQSGGRTVYRI
jgi:hypothetical protein